MKRFILSFRNVKVIYFANVLYLYKIYYFFMILKCILPNMQIFYLLHKYNRFCQGSAEGRVRGRYLRFTPPSNPGANINIISSNIYVGTYFLAPPPKSDRVCRTLDSVVYNVILFNQFLYLYFILILFIYYFE